MKTIYLVPVTFRTSSTVLRWLTVQSKRLHITRSHLIFLLLRKAMQDGEGQS